ncbi:hypothetical protein [Endozoicomonas sp. GU-1]|uniref:hypothetical protein n=1 Tax=Endozoicomonas sp. GU-1 TaxID=3009078 RepID=UPI0022B43F0D|nr:hypothetical protein [Endozoicomonas sp. GU-1]WBA82613.1 hypothetical protein O2T12_05590 [Endozoicomonas sp. GU-1]WBA85542.1 hypothetical protein O3276_20245 [Endozoicomonas sp. GU-1]
MPLLIRLAEGIFVPNSPSKHELSRQGFILKANASTYSRPKPAGHVAQQAGSRGTPGHSRSTFNGKRVSNHPSYRGRTPILDVGKRVEDAFWDKNPLKGRQISSAAVLGTYRNDRTSLRGGFFLQKLCLQNILHGNRKVSPDQVIQEFNRKPDGDKKCKLAIIRFKAECCLRGLLLNGRQVSPDTVINDFKAVKAALELARFKAECCLRGLLLNDQLVTTDAVVEHFPDSPEGRLGLARFKEQCCLMGKLLNDQQVTPDTVVKGYQATKATLELGRFIEQCCIRGLPLNGQRVTPATVVREYQSAGAYLELARFKADCCLKGLSLSGQQVSPDTVVKDCQVANATLVLVRFKEECCLRGLALNGQKVTPEEVVEDFQKAGTTLEQSRFKAECCLRGLFLNGQQITPEEVVRDYQAIGATLELARFKAECCLRGLELNGQQVAPDAVITVFPDSLEGSLGRAIFRAQCCLRGLLVNGQQVRPDSVVKDFPDSPEGKLGIARFQEECCLRGLALNGQKATPEAVIKAFPDTTEGRLGIARFMQECCLKRLVLNGQQVTADAVVKAFPNSSEGRLGIARFKQECCLRKLVLNGQLVTPDEVYQNFQTVKATLEIARFKEECCLKGLPLNGQQVTPEAVVKDYERGGWLLERAIFYSLLALHARELNGNYLDNQKVLEAFNEVPGDHSSRQVMYLIQRLNQSQGYDETSEAQDIIQTAWQLLNNVSLKDEQHRLQCILKFMAMQNELTIAHQEVSAEQVLQSIKKLRNSFHNSRVHFFFLAHCYITRQSIAGLKVHKDQVLGCLHSFPEGSKLRHDLGFWFEQYSYEAHCVNINGHRHRDNLPDLIPNIENAGRAKKYRGETGHTFATQGITTNGVQTLKQWSTTGRPDLPENPALRLNALTLKTLEIIQEINVSYSNTPILITGSYARFLQDHCSLFNDIDIICTTEEPARILFAKLEALNTTDSDIPKSITIWQLPGCPEIKLPKTYNIHLRDADLCMKTMGLQVSVDARLTHENTAPLTVHVPGVARPVLCLSFADETKLMNDTLEYLAENLDPLTRQLQRGAVFDLQRTILFNDPQNIEERIYGLLIRSLLTLNKARQFIDLHSEGKPGTPDCLPEYRQVQQRLHTLTALLQKKLAGHVCRSGFEHRINNWLSTNQYVSDYEIKKKDFIKSLLVMMHSA